MGGVEQAGAAERGRDRQVEALREARHGGAGGFAPAAAAQHHDGALGRPEHLLQLRHLGQSRPGQRGFDAGSVVDRRHLGQHVLGQRDDDRARPALQRHVEGARQHLGDAGRIVDLDRPFGHRAEDGAIVHLLERPPAPHAALDLADEDDQRHGIVLGDVDPRHGVRRPGAARHHADPGAAGDARHRVGHHGGASLVPADREGDGRIVQRVQHREIALARHAEHMVHALGGEALDQDAAAAAGFDRRHDCASPPPSPPQAGSARISAACWSRPGAGRGLA